MEGDRAEEAVPLLGASTSAPGTARSSTSQRLRLAGRLVRNVVRFAVTSETDVRNLGASSSSFREEWDEGPEPRKDIGALHEDDCAGIVAESEQPALGEGGKTAFHPSLEKVLSEDLSGRGSLVFQGCLCLIVVLTSVYEVILKHKAILLTMSGGSEGKPAKEPFDFNGLIIWQAALSIIIGVLVALGTGQMGVMFNKNTPATMLRYLPSGMIFSFTAYLQFVILGYLPADVFKVLEQGRLLVVAILTWIILGRKQSMVSWMVLICITLSTAIYTFISLDAPLSAKHQDLLAYTQNLPAEPGYNVTLANQTGLDGAFYPPEVLGMPTNISDANFSEAVASQTREKLLSLVNRTALAGFLTNIKDDRPIKQLMLKEELTAKMHSFVNNMPFRSDKEWEYWKGLILVAIFVVLMCFASVYSEKVMKDQYHIPFYIQKVYLEVPVLLFGLLNTSVIAPYLASHGVGKSPAAEGFFTNPFAGWNNRWVIATFVCLVLKSWLSGFLVKMLSAIAKQICAVVAVALTYFMLLVHSCDMQPYNGDAMFCPEGVKAFSPEIATANFGVFFAVSAYVLVQSQQRELQGLQEAADKLENSDSSH